MLFKIYYILTYPLTLLCLLLLLIYRKIIKWFLPRSCHFMPTCSKYSWDSIVEFGAIIGCVLTLKRILNCKSNHKAGLDLPKLNLYGNYKWKC